jgi:hypothetical protein
MAVLTISNEEIWSDGDNSELLDAEETPSFDRVPKPHEEQFTAGSMKPSSAALFLVVFEIISISNVWTLPGFHDSPKSNRSLSSTTKSYA